LALFCIHWVNCRSGFAMMTALLLLLCGHLSHSTEQWDSDVYV